MTEATKEIVTGEEKPVETEEERKEREKREAEEKRAKEKEERIRKANFDMAEALEKRQVAHKCFMDIRIG